MVLITIVLGANLNQRSHHVWGPHFLWMSGGQSETKKLKDFLQGETVKLAKLCLTVLPKNLWMFRNNAYGCRSRSRYRSLINIMDIDDIDIWL